MMPRPRPPHLHREINRHGNTVWYVRLGKGQRVRIKGVYGTPEFDAAYRAAIKGELPRAAVKAPKASLEWLWLLYRQTNAWTELSLATRRQRENIMRGVLTTAGDKTTAAGHSPPGFSSPPCAGFTNGPLMPST